MAVPKIVRQMGDIQDAVNDMTKAMASTPERESEKNLQISEFKKKFPDAIYLTPSTKIPTGGIPHPEFEKQREYLWEYVVGIFESQMIMGKLEFFLTGLPGDDYCKWSIPANKPVGVPRFVAKHLEKGLGWKEMKPIARTQDPQAFNDEDICKPFEQFEYKKRGNFHPISAY